MAQTATLSSAHDDAACPEVVHGVFYWNELMTRDVERAKSFYGDTIGWTFAPNAMPDGRTYWVASQADRPVAGIFRSMRLSSTAYRKVGWPISPSTTSTRASRRRSGASPSSWSPAAPASAG